MCEHESVKVKVWKWNCESESVKVKVWKCESESMRHNLQLCDQMFFRFSSLSDIGHRSTQLWSAPSFIQWTFIQWYVERFKYSFLLIHIHIFIQWYAERFKYPLIINILVLGENYNQVWSASELQCVERNSKCTCSRNQSFFLDASLNMHASLIVFYIVV